MPPCYLNGRTVPCRAPPRLPETKPRKPAKPTTVERSLDSRNSKRLKKLNATDLAAFEPPSFQGCTNYRHCMLGNVCLSRHDGVLVPNASGAASIAELDRPHDTGAITKPWAARVLPMSYFERLTNVYYAKGKTYAAGCWRQRRSLVGAGWKSPCHGRRHPDWSWCSWRSGFARTGTKTSRSSCASPP